MLQRFVSQFASRALSGIVRKQHPYVVLVFEGSVACQRVPRNAGLGILVPCSLDMGRTLETIAAVGITPTQKLNEAGSDIEREENDTPALVLSNVNMLMTAHLAKGAVIDTDDHVAEGHRDDAS